MKILIKNISKDKAVLFDSDDIIQVELIPENEEEKTGRWWGCRSIAKSFIEDTKKSFQTSQ